QAPAGACRAGRGLSGRPGPAGPAGACRAGRGLPGRPVGSFRVCLAGLSVGSFGSPTGDRLGFLEVAVSGPRGWPGFQEAESIITVMARVSGTRVDHPMAAG
ncbi:hypothetical protein LADH09A_000349, partial [Micromonospora sp. LAH09]|nr:hypothetical protein [Micromonospora cabrerizensis]